MTIFNKGDWTKHRLVEAEEALAEEVSEEIFTEKAYANRYFYGDCKFSRGVVHRARLHQCSYGVTMRAYQWASKAT